MSMPLIRPRASPVSRLYCVSSLISMIRARSSLSWSSMDSPSVTRKPSIELYQNATGVVVTGQIAVVRGDKGTTDDGWVRQRRRIAGRGQCLGSDVVDVAFAEQPGGKPAR